MESWDPFMNNVMNIQSGILQVKNYLFLIILSTSEASR